MTDRTRLFLVLILILIAVSVVVGGSLLAFLYRVNLDSERERLIETAAFQAKVAEKIAERERALSGGGDSWKGAALGQLREVIARFGGPGQTGEIMLGERDGGRITFLIARRGGDFVNPDSVSWESDLAEPMRRALSGETGAVVGLDYSGTEVMAAYEPLPALEWGIVAKIELAEFRAPFVRAALLGLGVAAVAIVLGAILLARIAGSVHRELEESRERFREAVEAAPNGMLLVDEAGRITLVNRRLEAIFGYGREELLGRPLEVLIPPRFREGHVGMRLTFQSNPQARPMGVGRDLFGLRKDGTEVPVEIGLNPIKTPVDRFVLASVADITARVAAAEEIRREKEFAEHLIEAAQTVILVLDREGRIVRFNPYMEDLSGYRIREVAGRDWFETLLPARDRARIRELFARSVDGLEVRGGANPIVTKDGREREIEWYSKTLHDSAGRATGVLSVGQDITERLRAEREIRELNAGLERRIAERTAELEVANQELSALSYTISHDLRAPIRALLGFSRILVEDHAGELGPEARRSLDRVAANARRLEELVDGLLNLFRVARGPMRKEAVDLSAVAREILAGLAARDPARSVETRVEEGVVAEGDSRLFRTVLENLLENAWKFTRHREHARIEFGTERGEGARACFVRDNGAGFDGEYAAKLFQPFGRLHTSEEFEGTGIGLATVARIIARRGGRVWAEGAPDEGATFWFTI